MITILRMHIRKIGADQEPSTFFPRALLADLEPCCIVQRSQTIISTNINICTKLHQNLDNIQVIVTSCIMKGRNLKYQFEMI